MLARAVVRGDSVDPGQLCRAAIVVQDAPPADPIVASVSDYLVQVVMDYAYFWGAGFKSADRAGRLSDDCRRYQDR